MANTRPQYIVHLAIVEQFALGLLADNQLMAESVASGTPIELSEVVELAAGIRSLYNLATLTSRELNRVKDCYTLWTETRDQFEQLCRAWAGVPQDGELISWHRAQLEHLRLLARDRTELYSISEAERLEHAANRAVGLEMAFSQRHELEPRGEQGQSAPAHVYSVGHF
jgi:hypothetical protein